MGRNRIARKNSKTYLPKRNIQELSVSKGSGIVEGAGEGKGISHKEVPGRCGGESECEVFMLKYLSKCETDNRLLISDIRLFGISKKRDKILVLDITRGMGSCG